MNDVSCTGSCRYETALTRDADRRLREVTGDLSLAEWDESKHPRASDGKFASAAGGKSSKTSKAKAKAKPKAKAWSPEQGPPKKPTLLFGEAAKQYISDVKAYAKHHGVSVDDHGSRASIHSYIAISEGIAAVSKAGYKLPRSVSLYEDEESFGYWEPSNTTQININDALPPSDTLKKYGPRSKNLAKKSPASHWSTVATPAGVFAHEVGHMLHYKERFARGYFKNPEHTRLCPEQSSSQRCSRLRCKA